MKYSSLRVGGLGTLSLLIKLVRMASPGSNDEVFPPWQGMQYMHNMFEGSAEMHELDNFRYPDVAWSSVSHHLSLSGVFSPNY